MKKKVVRALTVAGSDSGGCAGIQADLKTFAAFGLHGMSVLTAITAQNTCGVTAVQSVSPSLLEAQLEAIFSDMPPQAVKSGMISSPIQVRVIARLLQKYRVKKYVLDPVMIATSGARLMPVGTQNPICRRLMPLSLVVTPNLYEAEILAGNRIPHLAAMREAARIIHDYGCAYVYIKGGHLPGPLVDVLFDGRNFCELYAPRIRTRNLHGSGCTLASAICAGLAKGQSVPDAVAKAKDYITVAIQRSYSVGKGPGPLGHFSTF
jgi:hydroxymethylpyrimidine/phosphomethylpyrimidine kinase